MGSLELCILYTLHHLIVRGIERRTIVDDFADRKNFVKRPAEPSAATKTGIYAWAPRPIMHSQKHLLFTQVLNKVHNILRKGQLIIRWT